MRAIDADAMIDRLKEWDTKDKTDKALYNFTLNRINEQPTIQLAEPKRIKGKWILKNDHPVYGPGRKCVCCSACGWAAFQDTRLGQRVILNDEFHYCPQCGARMEGEQNG